VQQTGARLDIYDDPDNRFVAGFIGSSSMTFVLAIVTGCVSDHLLHRTKRAEAHDFRALVQQQIPEGTEVAMGIRPEHSTIADGGMLVGVEVSEELSDVSYLYTRMTERQGSRDWLDGATIGISADHRHILVFDKAGTRLR